MKWTGNQISRLKEINEEKKLQRYFSIKKLVEDIVAENLKPVIEFKFK